MERLPYIPDYIGKEKNFDKFKKPVKTYYFGEAYSDLA